MDPITLIVAALAAGVSTSLKDAAGEAVKDAYAGLKALLKRKVGAQSVIDKHEQAPEVWEKPLEQELGDAKAGDDEEIVRAAQKLLELADPDGARAGKYNVTISGGKGIVVGDNAQVTMNFDDTD